MDWLGVVWYSLVGCGFVAALTGLAAAEHRATLLTVAGGLFLAAGFLGILSIGIAFIGLAALCFRGAHRATS